MRGAVLAKTYPDDDPHESFALARPSMPSVVGRPMRAFVAALMLLAGMILLAACANLGSLFAARAADRGREVALRLALGSRRGRILRQFLIEASLISLAGGAVGLLGSIALLRLLDTWQPFSGVPLHVPTQPDANVYIAALVLALVSALLFGIVPVRQVLRANPYEIVKAGATGGPGRRSLRARSSGRCADRHLCRAGHFVDGRRARAPALDAQQSRHPAGKHDAR